MKHPWNTFVPLHHLPPRRPPSGEGKNPFWKVTGTKSWKTGEADWTGEAWLPWRRLPSQHKTWEGAASQGVGGQVGAGPEDRGKRGVTKPPPLGTASSLSGLPCLFRISKRCSSQTAAPDQRVLALKGASQGSGGWAAERPFGWGWGGGGPTVSPCASDSVAWGRAYNAAVHATSSSWA
jgi:hypothetical protein